MMELLHHIQLSACPIAVWPPREAEGVPEVERVQGGAAPERRRERAQCRRRAAVAAEIKAP